MLLPIWAKCVRVTSPKSKSIHPEFLFHKAKLQFEIYIYCSVLLNMTWYRNDYKLRTFRSNLKFSSRRFYMTWQNCILLLHTMHHHDPISREWKIRGGYVSLFLGTRNTCTESKFRWSYEPRLPDPQPSAVYPRQSTFSSSDDKLTQAEL
jgi:hypothetical protein